MYRCCNHRRDVSVLSLGGRGLTRGVFFGDNSPEASNAESIYSALVECLKEKNLQVSKIVGMGFDGAGTFSGKKTGVQTRIKKLAPNALFVHCHCHLMQLACFQAANSTNGIKHDCVCDLDSFLEVLPLLPKESGVSQNGPTSASSSRVEDCQTFRYTMAGT